MNNIPPLAAASQLVSPTSSRSGTGKPPVAVEPDADQLDISETGRLLSGMDGDSGSRAERIALIRQAIADGTYETPEKIDVTVGRLMDVLQSMNVTA